MNFLPEPIRILLYLVGICAFVGANAAYLVLAERKGAGRIQRRPGPNEAGFGGLLQPLADGLKLLAKQVMVPPGTDALLFRAAPVLVMAPPLMCLAMIPFSDSSRPATSMSGCSWSFPSARST
jgi:NADH-quinone oxidoreductase subunit H